MSWIIAIGIFIALFVVAPYFVGIFKDNRELRRKPFREKFKVTLELLNTNAFNGHGVVSMTSNKTFQLYPGDTNQIISGDYFFGHLTIIWKFKFLQNEVIHKKIFHDLRNLSIETQRKIAEEMIEEMAIVIMNHKEKVMSS